MSFKDFWKMKQASAKTMRRPVRSNVTAPQSRPRLSFGFSGAGFLGCYHVGAAACLMRQGHLPRPADDRAASPRLTGVSAGSMIAAAVFAGVPPDPDGMEVVLEAARRARALARTRVWSLDVLTPGFSLIDAVEGPFRKALAQALGGYREIDEHTGEVRFRDIDPELFARRFPEGSLRIGLTDPRAMWPAVAKAYRYVERYRDLEDVVACSMLSSYIPGVTGPLKLRDKDTSDRAGARLKEMVDLGFVHYYTGVPVFKDAAKDLQFCDG